MECTRVNGIVVFASCAAVNLNGAWKRDDKAIGGEGERERERRRGALGDVISVIKGRD